MHPPQGNILPKIDLAELRQKMKPLDMTGEHHQLNERYPGSSMCSDFYATMSYFAQFGPTYQRIQCCSTRTGASGRIEALTEVRGDDGDLPKYVYLPVLDHPAIVVSNPNTWPVFQITVSIQPFWTLLYMLLRTPS